MLPIVLASASPRRQELIQLYEIPVRVEPADVDELSIQEPDPAKMVVATALLKAEWVAARQDEPSLVVGSDTTVALGWEQLGKPADEAEARATLRRLRGRVHQVHTGVVVIETATGRTLTDVATVDVQMRQYTDAEIEEYLATGDPLDKAGSYGIQHLGFRPVPHLSGCYAGVMGLPLCHLARLLRQFQVHISPMIATTCQTHNRFECQVFEDVLSGRSN